MSTNFCRTIFRQPLSNSKFRFCAFIKTQHRLDQDFRQTFFSHSPFHHSSWYSVKWLFQINKTRVHSYVFSLMFFLQLCTKNNASAVPFPGMKLNCASSKSTNACILLSNTFNNLHVMFQQLHSPIQTTVHRIFFSLQNWHYNAGFSFIQDSLSIQTRWQSCSITSSAILLPAIIISIVVSESPAGLHPFSVSSF